MPTPKARLLKLQCPFCTTISTRGTGLSSHIRSQHPREYGKWKKNPSRLADAASAASSGKVSAKTPSVNPVQPLPVHMTAEARRSPRAESRDDLSAPAVGQGSGGAGGDDARGLVQKAYHQLSARKQSIEAELARIEVLRADHERVTAQVAALDEAMKAFQQQDEQQRKAR
jgi:hypothetical protein